MSTVKHGFLYERCPLIEFKQAPWFIRIRNTRPRLSVWILRQCCLKSVFEQAAVPGHFPLKDVLAFFLLGVHLVDSHETSGDFTQSCQPVLTLVALPGKPTRTSMVLGLVLVE
jgi:hypothetical protein